MIYQYESNRIYLNSKDGQLIAELTYEIDDQIMDINHTYVNESYRHQGHGQKILEEAIHYAQLHHYKIKASCPFVNDEKNQYQASNIFL